MTSITHVHLNEGESLIVEKKSTKQKPNFYMIGNGSMNRHKIKSIDLLEEAMSLTKAGQFVLRIIKNEITYDNATGVVYISMADLTKTQIALFGKGFKELKEKELAARTKRSHYMINPNALVPSNYEEAITIWNGALEDLKD